MRIKMKFSTCIGVILLYISCASCIPPIPPQTTTEPPQPNIKCGYQSCNQPKDGFINVHIVPHTHDDVGWLKTVDQYFYGSKSDIQKAGVEYILDSVIPALKLNPDRKFIYVETAFFWKWWIKQHDFVKRDVRKLVINGQLEFIGGGWVMNDEATTHYQSTIDQFTWGLRKLEETFGECGRPKAVWQIDPFGHSRESASIFSQLGFDGLLLGRIDYQDKSFRFNQKLSEGLWKTSDSLNNDLFTSVMYNNYAPPPGFCFDILCDDEPIIDDKKSPDYNVDKKISKFFDWIANETQAYKTNNIILTMGGDFNYIDANINDFFAYVDNMTKAYSTENVIVTMGEDFNYQQANLWFKNLDKLIKYGNARQANGSKYNLFYSTPSCYLKAVHDAGIKRNINWPVKTDDFFPYASDPHAFWTGYFTSRPTLKRFERMGNNFLQICKQLYSLTNLGPEDWADLNVLREAMGVMQHHDAITGTEKQQVAFDYARLLSNGFEECQFIAKTALSKIVTNSVKEEVLQIPPQPETTSTTPRTTVSTIPTTTTSTTTTPPPVPLISFESCLLSNISQCDFTEHSQSFIVTIYNPLSRPVSQYARIPVYEHSYSVTGPDGKNVQTQVLPIPDFIQKLPGRNSIAEFELIFFADNLPPLGFKSYYVQASKNLHLQPKPRPIKLINNKKLYINNDIMFQINQNTGLLAGISVNNVQLPITQEFLYYEGMVGNNEEFINRSSGAYIFRPKGNDAYPVSNKAEISIFKGDLVVEVHQKFNEWVNQIIRIYHKENFFEFDWTVGPIPNDSVNGKEVISRFTTQLNTSSTFYTDSNGREMLKRVRNFRPTWKLNLEEPVAGNYYPVTSKILMRDQEKDIEIAVLTDRAQGGSSLKDGQIELMVHRNCHHDDAFGVGEALNETAFGKGLVARGSHYLFAGKYLEDAKEVQQQQKDLAQRKILSAWSFYSPTNNLPFDSYKVKYLMEYSGLKTEALPDNVQILTLEPWKKADLLIRLEHVYEKKDNPELAKPVTVDLSSLFKPFAILSAQEMTLGANKPLKDSQKEKLVFAKGLKLQDIVNVFVLNHVDFNNKTEVKSFLDYEEKWKIWNSDQTESNYINSKINYEKSLIEEQETNNVKDDFKVVLNPMQIRTFIIEIKMN